MKRMELQLEKNKKAYFAGDFHLGKPDKKSSIEREKKIIEWLEIIKVDAQELFLMGDVFDFWFEYKHVVPKDYLKLVSKISEIIDSGINVHYFKGNHDLWTLDYFEKLGIKLYDQPQSIKLDNKKILVGHGDGLGSGDFGYKILKKIFSNSICQNLFRLIHPDIGIRLGNFFSRSHKKYNTSNAKKNNDRIINYCKNYEKDNHMDAYIFGHSHYISKETISNNSRYYNSGDWMNNSSYLEFYSNKFEIKKFNL